MRTHVCKNPSCQATFTKQKPGQKVCSVPCAIAYSRIEREEAKKKADRKEYRERKAALKTRREWLNEAQAVFNKYIRLRDQNQPCICCGITLGHGEVGGQYDCGHYRSVGSAPHLRFDERNAHAQRKQCNRYGSGRAVDYRIGLIKRIGIKAVEELEADQSTRKWTIDELKELISKYKSKAKDLA